MQGNLVTLLWFQCDHYFMEIIDYYIILLLLCIFLILLYYFINTIIFILSCYHIIYFRRSNHCALETVSPLLTPLCSICGSLGQIRALRLRSRIQWLGGCHFQTHRPPATGTHLNARPPLSVHFPAAFGTGKPNTRRPYRPANLPTAPSPLALALALALSWSGSKLNEACVIDFMFVKNGRKRSNAHALGLLRYSWHSI